jgi:hypothetical protein
MPHGQWVLTKLLEPFFDEIPQLLRCSRCCRLLPASLEAPLLRKGQLDSGLVNIAY